MRITYAGAGRDASTCPNGRERTSSGGALNPVRLPVLLISVLKFIMKNIMASLPSTIQYYFLIAVMPSFLREDRVPLS